MWIKDQVESKQQVEVRFFLGETCGCPSVKIGTEIAVKGLLSPNMVLNDDRIVPNKVHRVVF